MQNRFEQFSQNIIAMHTGSAGAFDPARMMFPPEEKEASSQEMQNLYMTNVYRIQNLTEENYLYRQNFQFLTQMFEKQIHKKLYPQVERQVENALKVVDFLAHDAHVAKVNHPSLPNHPDHELYKKYFPNGGGSIFTFEIKGDAQKAKDFIDNLELFSLLANVADVKSLVIHPASTTHAQLTEEELKEQGIYPNTIRLSIGTENIDDIIEDLDEAFKAVAE